MFGLEADQKLAADIEHRPLDHRGLGDHQRDRLLLAEAFLVLVRQLAEGRAGAIEQALPADLGGPAFEAAALDAGRLVVVEVVGDAVAVQPGPRLFHRVTILDAVDRYRLRHARGSLKIPTEGCRLAGAPFVLESETTFQGENQCPPIASSCSPASSILHRRRSTRPGQTPPA